jgi:hypothetical protein
VKRFREQKALDGHVSDGASQVLPRGIEREPRFQRPRPLREGRIRRATRFERFRPTLLGPITLRLGFFERLPVHRVEERKRLRSKLLGAQSRGLAILHEGGRGLRVPRHRPVGLSLRLQAKPEEDQRNHDRHDRDEPPSLPFAARCPSSRGLQKFAGAPRKGATLQHTHLLQLTLGPRQLRGSSEAFPLGGSPFDALPQGPSAGIRSKPITESMPPRQQGLMGDFVGGLSRHLARHDETPANERVEDGLGRPVKGPELDRRTPGSGALRRHEVEQQGPGDVALQVREACQEAIGVTGERPRHTAHGQQCSLRNDRTRRVSGIPQFGHGKLAEW